VRSAEIDRGRRRTFDVPADRGTNSRPTEPERSPISRGRGVTMTNAQIDHDDLPGAPTDDSSTAACSDRQLAISDDE